MIVKAGAEYKNEKLYLVLLFLFSHTQYNEKMDKYKIIYIHFVISSNINYIIKSKNIFLCVSMRYEIVTQ